MNLFAWAPEYSVGSADVDEEHRNLFQMAESVENAMRTGQPREVLSRRLTELIGYTKHHFACEDRLMQQSGYPDCEAHQLEHMKLTNQAIAFERAVLAGRTGVAHEILLFLSDWLKHHIEGPDRKAAAYFRQVSIKSSSGSSPEPHPAAV